MSSSSPQTRRRTCPIFMPPKVFPGREAEGKISIIQDHQKELFRQSAMFLLPLWGAGAGKSITVALWHCWKAMGAPRGLSAYVAKTGPMLRTVVDVKLNEIHDTFQKAHGIPLFMQHHKTEMTYTLINGHIIMLKPSDDPDKLQGAEYSHVSIEEAGIIANQERVFTQLAERGRVCPTFQMAMPTTFNPWSWIIRHCRERAEQGDPNYWVTRRASTANALVLPANLEAIKGTMSATRYAMEIGSDDDAIIGDTVYGGSFHRLDSVARDFSVRNIEQRDLNTRFVLVLGVDWGLAQGHMVAVLRDRRDDREYIIDDLPIIRGGHTKSAQAVCERAVMYAKEWGLIPKVAYTDPTGKTWNEDLKAMFRQAGLPTEVQWAWGSMDRDIQHGVELVRRRLLDGRGVRHLFISPAILKLDWNRANGRGVFPSFQGYRYRLTREEEVTGKPWDDDKHTHSMDALRYVFAFEDLFIESRTGLR